MSIAQATRPNVKRPAPIELDESAPAAERLLAAPQQFDFFQAVRLLEQMLPARRQVGGAALPEEEVVRFQTPIGSAFPASSIAELTCDEENDAPPEMTVAFLGLTGPSGALPAHYSELLLRLERDTRTPEKRAIRAWFDLFNHRLVSLFYRAWEKYRPAVAYERGEYRERSPDRFMQALLSVAGLGAARAQNKSRCYADELPQSLVRYAGLLAQRPRNVANLAAILNDYFALPIAIEQFQGEWFALAEDQQARLGCSGSLGVDAPVGPRVWNRQGKIRLRIGPLARECFERLLPDPVNACETEPNLGEMAAVAWFYLGPEIDFDLQLILRGDGIPAAQLGGEDAARLGWNTWLPGEATGDRDEAVFTPSPLAPG